MRTAAADSILHVMPPEPAAPETPPPAEADLSRTYLLVLVVEALTLAALYWLGRHFS
jgi:hypothetical protein